jgi:hypothetical protein
VAADASWVVCQTGGVRGAPEQLPGTGTDVTINSLSCWSAGNCAAGGSYVAGGLSVPFVASETNGNWSGPEPVPGIMALNKQNSSYNGVVAVSCPSARRCTAAGTYSDAPGRTLGFVTGPACLTPADRRDSGTDVCAASPDGPQMRQGRLGKTVRLPSSRTNMR